MNDDLDAVRALLPAVRLDGALDLGGSARSAVCRVRARNDDGSDTTLIVKRFFSAGEVWVRETAALSIILPGAGLPVVIASSAQPPIIVMSDLGSGPTLADALLGEDPELAASTLVLWA